MRYIHTTIVHSPGFCQLYQVVGIVDYNLSDGGTAGIGQVGVGMVDGESTQAYGEARREDLDEHPIWQVSWSMLDR